ncbi:hypothetical protein M413DRAFT_75217 [Hebeloma cylindrosporum]|uniref:Nudix hydrolase domain-containing protein n=1 Tax=Hebeloma cylindrosporum TaxID=76867 RepID=A0A0C2YDC4_HEBCY|nr:hypothetical protein M413DRAFT_75217 [Hebeloma cylindrosporum h7]
MDGKDKPTSGISAVLVLLFEREGHLRVLLTTRAKGLKVHGGETCLPGGHMEDGDGRNIEVTAHREAHEEVSLPLFLPHIHTLGILEPHPFRHLIVVPVVALLTDNSILRQLKNREKEVEHIFSHPLEAILDPQLAGSICGEYSNAHGKDVKIGERLVEHGSEHWPHESKYQHHKDYVVQALGGMTYRLQRFQTSASPITGTTADILVSVHNSSAIRILIPRTNATSNPPASFLLIRLT